MREKANGDYDLDNRGWLYEGLINLRPKQFAYALLVLFFCFESLLSVVPWDANNTLALNPFGLVVAILLFVLPTAVYIAYQWFRPRPWGVEPPLWNLKEDSFGIWTLTGLAISILSSALLGWIAYVALSVCAQMLPGRTRLVTATVVDMQDVASSFTACRLRATLQPARGSAISPCVSYRWRSTLFDKDLQLGTAVTLVIKENFVGSALYKIQTLRN